MPQDEPLDTSIDIRTAVTALKAAIESISGASWAGAGGDRRHIVQLDHLDAATFNQRLVEHGVPVAELVSRGRTLEDLFLSLTASSEI